MLKQSSFTLQPYQGSKTRHTCPACNRPRSFALYVDSQTGELLSPNVGRCNREDSCGYHYKPKQFFLDNPTTQEQCNTVTVQPRTVALINPVQPSYIPFEVFADSLHNYEDNRFIQWLASLFGNRVTEQLIQRFYIGTSTHWEGATIFWQVDNYRRIHAGKVMLYDSLTGKRVKKPYNHIHWVHSLLMKKGTVADFNLCQCFFGEHQLQQDPCKPVAIVESEKTAIVASVYLPEYVWLATGGKNGCKWATPEVYRVLKGKRVTLFPDLNAFDQWKEYAQLLQSNGLTIKTSDLLERMAMEPDRVKGLDLVDYFVRRDTEYGWALSEQDYPLFWDNQ